MKITIYIEKKRGCGFKKPGGIYLIGSSDKAGACCRLPFELKTCECCGSSVTFSRGYTWINTGMFCYNNIAGADCTGICILNEPGKPIGLMWVGENNYPHVKDFERESNAIGVSKRLNVIPKGLSAGDWVALAHNKAIPVFNEMDPADPNAPLVTYKPGVFMVFKIEKLQYVVKGSESDDDLQKIADKNIELITVVPEGEPIKMF
ncbi:MAG TPA: hypothetical protein VK609_22975 [Mucilaginibacter sp.]|nr:hypothetical protein [Mucilaginibacter sp.]